jgi:hypothetical protein
MKSARRNWLAKPKRKKKRSESRARIKIAKSQSIPDALVRVRINLHDI